MCPFDALISIFGDSCHQRENASLLYSRFDAEAVCQVVVVGSCSDVVFSTRIICEGCLRPFQSQ